MSLFSRLFFVLVLANCNLVSADIVAYLDDGRGTRGVFRFDRSGNVIEEIAEELNYASPPSAESGYVGNQPVDVAVDGNGDILILNWERNGTSNSKYQVYRFNGQTNAQVGKLHEITSGQYRDMRVAPNGNIVLNRYFSGAQFTVLSETGVVLATPNGPSYGGNIMDFMVRENGNYLIYVRMGNNFDPPYAKIVEFDPASTTFIRTIGENILGRNGGSASVAEFSDGRIVAFSGGSPVSPAYPSGLLEFSSTTGSYLGVLNDFSEAIGSKRYTLDENENLYAIGERGLNLFTSSGAFVETVIDESAPGFPAGFDRVYKFALIPPALPVANAGADQTVFDDDLDGQASVTLDGSASTSGRPITTYLWTWDDGGPQSASGVSPAASFPLGTTVVNLTVTDDGGNMDSDVMEVAVALPSFDVTFDLLGQGYRTGGGALNQVVVAGNAATEPEVTPLSGWIFAGWDTPFDNIVSDLTVTAVYGTDFNDSGPTDDAYVTSDREPPSDDTPSTVEVGSLTLNPGIAFELGPNETLVLNSGPLTIESGASFTANGVIQGSIVNKGLLRIPVVGLPDIVNFGVIEVIVEELTMITEPLDLQGGLVSFKGGDVTITGPSQTNAGILSSDASLEITGDYSQTSDGALRTFISGNAPGVTYSQLESGGNVSMNGELQIVFRPDDLGYLPEPGDTFDFVVANGGGTITLDPSMQVKALVESTQTGAFDEDAIPYSPFDSGLGPVIDPDDLQLIGQTMFSVALADGETVLRATYIGPELTDFYDNAPTDIFASGNSVSEADGPGTVIATLSATSPIGGGHSFALVPGEGSADNGLFSVSGDQLVTAADLDFETSSMRQIRLQATNDENRTFEKMFIVEIINSLADDDDGDGLTEEQELALGTQALSADSDADGVPDGDEVNDWGTDPLNSSDRFRYAGEVLTIDGPLITVEWETKVGKSYKLEGNVGLEPSAWMELPGTVNGTGGAVSLQVDVTGTDYRFFRVKVF